MMPAIENTLQDFRFSLRSWVKHPAFATAAIATLALGIGANTAIFSVTSGVLLRPLPFPGSERLVQVEVVNPTDGVALALYRELDEWRAHSTLFEGMTTAGAFSRNLQGVAQPEQVQTVNAERNLFRVLQVDARAGRTFGENDSLNLIVASSGFAQRHFGSEQAAINRSIVLDGAEFTIIGVMPEGFRFPIRSTAGELWIPIDLPPIYRTRPNGRVEVVTGRLKPGVSLEVARQELNAMVQRSDPGRVVVIKPLKDVVGSSVRQSLLVLLGAVGMVLLVACVNVANLLLVRTAARSREIAIRRALGAGRLRMIRQLLTESILLAFGGGVAGLALGIWGSRVLVRTAAEQIPRAGDIGFDWRVFAFLLLVCLVTGIGFGLAPAMLAARGGASALKSRGIRSKLRDGLVVVEVSLAFVLLAGAGLLFRTFLNLQHTNPGLNPENLLTVHMVVSGGPEEVALQQRVAQIPGVRAAAFISLLPLQSSGWSAFFNIRGRPGDPQRCELRYVTPGYFSAMGIPILRGRDFTGLENPKSELVILINETFARQYFPNEDPVGVALNRGLIIGVVGDVRQSSLGVPPIPEVFYAVGQNFAQIRSQGSTLVVRAAGPPEGLVSAVRAAVREVNPNQALFKVATMRQVIHQSLGTQRLYVWLLGLFAAMATLLAAAGIYGVIEYLVTLRTQEIGIRMALGADSGRVLRLVMLRGLMLVAIGLLLGIGGAAGLTRFLRNVLFGVTSTDPITFAGMALLLAAVALGACIQPARRASRVDPSVALRCE
jgi:predicted permease